MPPRNGKGTLPPRMLIQSASALRLGCTWRSAPGSLRLQSSDPEQQPLLDYNYFAEEFDIRRMREGVRLIVSLSEQQALAEHIQERMSPTDDDLASDEALDAFIGATAPRGTTYPALARWD